MRQRFQSGQGGTLVFYPPEARQLGPASSAAVTLKRSTGDDVPVPVVDSTAAVDGVATTLSAAALADARRVNVASAAGLRVGRRYLLQSAADGEVVEVKVDGFNVTSRDVLLRDPLGRDFAAGDALKGEEVSFALVAANTPDTALEPLSEESLPYPYRITPWLFRAAWAYSIAGASFTADQTYEVHARLLKPSLSPTDLSVLLPGTMQDLVGGVGHAQAADVIEVAWSDLLDDVSGSGLDPDKIMNPDRLAKPHRSRVLSLLSVGWLSEAGRQYHEARASDYKDDLAQLLESQDWYDHTGDAKEQAGEVLLHTTVIRR